LASKGREAFSGAWFQDFVRAPSPPKEAMGTRLIIASLPPASMHSA